MRRIIATLLFIFWPGLVLSPAQRSVFFAQNRPVASTGGSTPAYSGLNCSSGGNGVTTLNCTVTGVAAGSAIIVGTSWYNGTTTAPTIVDSAGGTAYSTAVQNFNSNGFIVGAVIPNVSAGSHTITVTWNGTVSYVPIAVQVFTGLNTTSSVLVTSSGIANGGSSTPPCATVTTTTPNQLVWSVFAVSGGGTYTAGSGYTLGADGASMYAVQATAGSYAPSFNTTFAGASGCMTMVLAHS
jgi:hypothetical protein